MTDKDDDYFIRNAILCWMHFFPKHKWTPIYEELAKRDSYVAKPTEPKPRAARRRKPRAEPE